MSEHAVQLMSETDIVGLNARIKELEEKAESYKAEREQLLHVLDMKDDEIAGLDKEVKSLTKENRQLAAEAEHQYDEGYHDGLIMAIKAMASGMADQV